VRRDLYRPLPADSISDLCEPLKVLEHGHRIVFEPQAIAYEETTEEANEEFSMRVRVAVRGMRGMLFMRRLFNPFRYGFVAYQLWSHKVMRWLVPVFMVLAFVSNMALLGRPLYNVTFALQLLLYGFAVLGLLLAPLNVRLLPFSLPLYLVTVNWAALVAMGRVLRGYRAVTWETVRR